MEPAGDAGLSDIKAIKNGFAVPKAAVPVNFKKEGKILTIGTSFTQENTRLTREIVGFLLFAE